MPVAASRAGAAPSIAVRDATPADLTTVCEIYAWHVRKGLGSFEEQPPTVDEISRRRDTVLALGLPYLVAESGEHVLGFAYAGAYRTRSAYRNTVEDSVYVAPGHARRGIGNALLLEVIARCAAIGKRQMIAVIGDSANLASIRMHEKLGFRLVGTVHGVGFKHGRWVDSVLMQRALGAGDSTPPDGGGP